MTINCLNQIFTMFGTRSYVHFDPEGGGSCCYLKNREYFYNLGIAISRTTPYNHQRKCQYEWYKLYGSMSHWIWPREICVNLTGKFFYSRNCMLCFILPTMLLSMKGFSCSNAGHQMVISYKNYTYRLHR